MYLGSPELSFVIALFVLYISDLFVLRYEDELLVSVRRDDFAVLDDKPILVMKKYLVMLNPLTPHRLVFRVPWGHNARVIPNIQNEVEWIFDSIRVLRIIGYLEIILSFVLFALFPALSLLIGFDAAFLAVGGLGYLLVFAIVFFLVSYRHQWPIESSKYFTLIFLLIACIPLAINAGRRVSLLIPIEHDATYILKGLLSSKRYEAAREHLFGRVLQRMDEGVDAKEERRISHYAEENLRICLIPK